MILLMFFRSIVVVHVMVMMWQLRFSALTYYMQFTLIFTSFGLGYATREHLNDNQFSLVKSDETGMYEYSAQQECCDYLHQSFFSNVSTASFFKN